MLSEQAMKERVHSSREDRDLTVDGLSKHHNEPMEMKAKADAKTVKITENASVAKLRHNTNA
jgi:hypothetical protein